MDFDFFELDNGIRLIHKQVKGSVSHLGVIMNTGSRDERADQHGMAHFVEHLIFKGTAKRKAYHVISRLEDVGGEIDAYTTKEETCIYAAFLNEYYERTVELFADIIFNSTYPDKELKKEKEVILDEINSYKDSPAELIFDDFEEQIFSGYALGRNILGTPKLLKGFTRTDVLNFVEEQYHTNQLVVCSVGDMPFKKLVSYVDKHFGKITTHTKPKRREVIDGYKPQDIFLKKKTHQSHCIIGGRAPSISDKQRLPLELLNNLLGGPGMNSRLNMALRERRGFTYNIESFYTPYTDTGILGIYFGTDKEKVEKCFSIIAKELKILREKPLGALQLHRAQKQLIGNLAISSENLSGLMLSIGRSYLLFNKVDSLKTVFEKIENLSAKQIQDAANEYLSVDVMSKLIYS